MIAHAVAGLPNECCGLLAGQIAEGKGLATEHYPLANELRSPTEFLSDARAMFAAVKDMRRQNVEVLAIYHSHPSSKPIPSKRDLELSYGPAVVNLIIGLVNEIPDVKAWWLNEASYDVAQWELV